MTADRYQSAGKKDDAPETRASLLCFGIGSAPTEEPAQELPDRAAIKVEAHIETSRSREWKRGPIPW